MIAGSRTRAKQSMTSKSRRGRHRLPRRRLGAGLLAAAVLAIGGGVTVAAFGSDPAPAHADALCDQMRAQYGSNWPCISVPTNTFQPTTNTPAPTTGSNGAGSGGPQVGSNIGPGPGEGNGTPIVTVPGQATPQPATGGGNGGSGPTIPNTGVVRPTAPQPAPPVDTTGQIPVVPSTAAPVVTTVPGAVTANPEPGTAPHALDSGSKQPEIPLAAWVVAGAAAFTAANPRVRRAASAGGLRSWSLLRRGGSERATVGPSQLVLINDPSSPKSYVFHEDVPPGGHIGVNPDGSATIYDATGKPLRQIAKPWAFDAAGRPQKTWYTVDENGNLVQHVEPAPNALYPLIGDPAVTDAGSGGGAGSGQSAVSSLKSDSGMKASPSGSWGGDPGFSSGAASSSGGDPGFSAGGQDGLQDGGNDGSQHGSGSGGGGATGGDSGCEPGDCVGGGSDTPAPAPTPAPDPPSNTFTPAPTAPEESTGSGNSSQGGSGTAGTGSESGGGGGSTSSGGASGAGGGGSSGDTTSTTGDSTDQVQPIDWTVPDRGDGGIFSGGIFGWWAAVQNTMAGLLQSFFEFIAAIMQWLKNLPMAIMTWLLSQAINGAEAFRHALQWLWDQLHIDNNNSPATPNNPPTNQTPSPPPATTEKPGETPVAPAPGTADPSTATPQNPPGQANTQQNPDGQPGAAEESPHAPAPGSWDGGAHVKVPNGWSAKPNKKGEGTRWQDPNNQGNGVRVDKGDPNSPDPYQRPDHVIVRKNGKVLGPDGKPLPGDGSPKTNPEGHIPLQDWLKWKRWDTP